jgi:hypothetical protein
MCFKVKTPSVNTDVSAASLVPETNAKEPDSPEYGGTNDTFNQKKGRQQLTIARNGVYNPTSM